MLFFGSLFAAQECAAIFNGIKSLKMKGMGNRSFPVPR